MRTATGSTCSSSWFVRPLSHMSQVLLLTSAQKLAVEETEKVFPALRTRVEDATVKLEEQIALAESGGATEDELATAKLALSKGKEEKTYTVDVPTVSA